MALMALTAVASAALPVSVTASIHYPGIVSYWDVDVTSGGNADLPNMNDYLGWCSDSQHSISQGTHTFQVYSSLGVVPAFIPPANWNKINYLINHKNGADWKTLQAAIWHYDGTPNPPFHWSINGWNPVKYAQLIADADANGGSYVPGPGDKYAAILYKSSCAQTIFIELPIPEIPVPEFPSLALPTGMILGMVYLVIVYRKREN